MNFLKNLFGGGSNGDRGADNDIGLYYYVQPRGCEEVVKVRIDPRNDLSINEEGGYWVRKIVRGTYRCFNPVELTLYYNDKREIKRYEIDKGKVVDEAAFIAWEQALAEKKAAAREHNEAVDAANAAADDAADA